MNTTIDHSDEWNPEETSTLPDASRAGRRRQHGLHRGALACFAAVILIGAQAGPAGAQEGKTPIGSFPFTISQPGSYYLTASYSSAANNNFVIFINADHVTLDLNGHSLVRLSGGPTDLSVAIFADNRRNIIVKNGQIQNFGVGVLLNSSSIISRNNVVEHMNIRGATSSGIIVIGTGSVIRHNLITDIGGYQSNSRHDTYGILFSGDFGRVVDNDVSNVFTATAFAGSQNATAIYASGKHSVIDSNRITRPATTLGAATLAVGIDLGPSTFCLLRNNSIFLAPSGGFLSAIGINCDAPGDSGCLLRDNVVEAPNIPYSGVASEGAGAPAESNFPGGL